MSKVFRLIIFSFLTSVSTIKAQSYHADLNNGWKFKQVDNSKWMPATVPGTVHTDLMANNIIPDPYYRDNETKLQWISEKDWEYKLEFIFPKKAVALPNAKLTFEGLDTFADVFLNGKKILSANNMFRTWTVDIKQQVKSGKNTLRIVFHSPDRVVDSLAKAALPLVRPSENNRHYARKAQYHYGWDWGPKLTTSGIWKGVKLEAYDLFSCGGAKVVNKPTVKLVQQPDSIGTSFYFEIDGKPVFMKGANWIPADMFLPRLTKERYRKLLVAAKEVNINMLRVWGGGIYESDYFYELCDSLGIYVWQDFMFAGAMYPGDEKFLDNVKAELKDNITRLNKYKCIVLWCGNNEIDEAWHNWGWQKQHNLSAQDSTKIWQEYLKLFKEIMPEYVKKYAPGIPYVSTSPKNGWGRKTSMTDGDAHYWGLWHGVEPIQVMKEKVPRFMSEYGMQAMPVMNTIKKYALPKDYDTASEVMKVHQKHRTGYANLAKYIEMEGLHPKTFEEYVMATQEVQSRALETSINAHMNSGGRCMGTLFWQFNDCWPVCSWSVIDYYGEKKKAYQTVKELYAKEVPFIKIATKVNQ